VVELVVVVVMVVVVVVMVVVPCGLLFGRCVCGSAAALFFAVVGVAADRAFVHTTYEEV
jgi:hypothetical protein